jgi:lipopolysaccharide export LptBFGC system permease protein LptF
MKKLLMLVFVTVLLFSCKNYKTEELFGSWTSDKMDLVLNKDKTMNCRIGGNEFSGRFKTFGNSMELINSEEKVIGSVSIKSLKNDTLILNLIKIQSNLITLVRKK